MSTKTLNGRFHLIYNVQRAFGPLAHITQQSLNVVCPRIHTKIFEQNIDLTYSVYIPVNFPRSQVLRCETWALKVCVIFYLFP